MHPRPYQLVDSTIGLMLTQNYVSMKNQRTIWKLDVITGSYQWRAPASYKLMALLLVIKEFIGATAIR